jgi:hypothetical protein
MRRAHWLVPARLFPLRRGGESDAGYLLRVDKWRRCHSLPSETYMHFETYESLAFHKKRKPRWISFSSLHALDGVMPLIGRNPDSMLTFVEALPALHRLFTRDSGNRTRVTELATLLRWPLHESE